MSRQRGARTETAAQRLERLATTARDGRRGEGDRLPVDAQQPCTTVVVAVDRELANVVLVAVVLDRDAVLWIRRVDAGDEPTVVPDLVLEHRSGQTIATEQLLQLRLHHALRHGGQRIEA